MGRRKKTMVKHYEISVWDNFDEGDLCVKEWDCDEARLQEIEDNYGNDPRYDIEIVDEWEEEADE